MFIYVFIFIVIAIFSFFDLPKKEEKILVFIVFCFLLSLFAGFRGPLVGKDYTIYQEYFDLVPAGISFLSPPGFVAEPLYTFIPAFTKLIGLSIVWVFVVYAFLGVFIKGAVIVRSTPFIFLALLVYYSNFFLLHEMTQIRIGVAFGIFLTALPFLYDKKLLRYSCMILLACCFHFSAIIYWAVYFIDHKKLNKKLYFFLILVIFPIALFKIDPISIMRQLHLGVFTEKIEFYYAAMEDGTFDTKINLFNVFTLINIGLCTLFVWKIELLQLHFKYAVLFVKMYVISLLIFVSLAFMPPLAFRMKELFEAVQFLLIPQIVYLFKGKYLGRVIVVSIAFILFFINVFHLELVKAYF